ncbi:TRAP transporter small permease [Brevibacillus marinus]|uniref:TRAP transporter small permease n=1 Tax=Brevibacillus marinus TaxID=2496837 RepID=UPI000F82F48E|nr:TRAP transporter small permease [Brevibacillus marinus]
MKRILKDFEDWTSGILLVIGMIILLYGLIMRYVLELPTTWQDEVARIFMVWGVFIGAAATLRENNHIQVELLYNVLPKPVQRYVDVFANLVTLCFFIFLFVSGGKLVIDKWETGQESLNHIPLWIIYLIMPLAGLLLVFRCVERVIHAVQGKLDSSAEGHGNTPSL